MSRSLGHRPYKKTDGYVHYISADSHQRPWRRKRGAVEWHTLYGLRYENGELRRAETEGRRPRAERVIREKMTYTYGRGLARSIKGIRATAKEFQGAARARERDAALKAVKTVNTRGRKAEFDRALDIEPYRTRGQAVWDAT
jgi:hypothetical protein